LQSPYQSHIVNPFKDGNSQTKFPFIFLAFFGQKSRRHQEEKESKASFWRENIYSDTFSE
jgi:hypothetical protein